MLYWRGGANTNVMVCRMGCLKEEEGSIARREIPSSCYKNGKPRTKERDQDV